MTKKVFGVTDFSFCFQDSGTNYGSKKASENILNNNATKHTPNNVKAKTPTKPTPTVTSTKADTKSNKR